MEKDDCEEDDEDRTPPYCKGDVKRSVADAVLGAAPPGPTVLCGVDSVWPGFCIKYVLVALCAGTETGLG